MAGPLRARGSCYVTGSLLLVECSAPKPGLGVGGSCAHVPPLCGFA